LFKRILILLSVLLALGSISVSAAAADELEPVIREQFDVYAKSIDIENAASQAQSDMITYARKGAHQDLVMGEGDAMTAVVLNSALYQYTFPQIAAAAIVRMQELSLSDMVLKGSCGWYSHGYSCSQRQYDDDGNGVFTKGLPKGAVYSGSKLLDKLTPNEYDETLELVGGSTLSRMMFREAERQDGMVTYDVYVTLFDEFDFDGDYSALKEQGKDTSKAELLTLIGKLLGLKEFHWSVEASFQVTVPDKDCDHGRHAYRWTYTADKDLIPSEEDGFTVNGVTKIEDVKSDGTLYAPYFRLDDTIILQHDVPWVIELQGKSTISQVLSPTENINAGYPYLLRTYKKSETGTRNYDQLFFTGDYRYYYLTEEEKEEQGVTSSIASVRDYYGVDFSEQFTSKAIQTYRLENRIAEDGSNMIWLLVDGVEVGPMNNCYQWKSSKTGHVNLGIQSDWVSGQDFYINYIGNKTVRMSTGTKALTIWENGQEIMDGGVWEETVTPPTCTEPGYITYQCTRCAYQHREAHGEVLKHQYEMMGFEWSENCTKATAKRVCEDCQHGEQTVCTIRSENVAHDMASITAEAVIDGQVFSETKTISAVRSGDTVTVTLPMAPENMQLWVAIYDDYGAFLEIRIMDAAETTMQLEVPHSCIRLFFLGDGWMPVFPSLQPS